MPEIRPFRALRYAPESVGDLAAVVAPPYDVLTPDDRGAAARAAPEERRSPRRCRATSSATRADDRYRRAARTLAAWRSDGTFHKDPRPSIYVYEQTYRVPGHRRRADPARVLRPPPAGAARARVRRPAPRAHARGAARGPLPAAPGDRREHEPGRRAVRRPERARSAAILATLAGRPGRRSTCVDDDGVRHRLWVVEAEGRRGRRSRELLGGRRRRARSRSPTATTATRRPLRYRDERRMSSLVRGGSGVRLPPDAVPRDDGRAADGPADPSDRPRAGRRRRRRACGTAWTSCSRSRPADRAELERGVRRPARAAGGAGRFGLWTRGRRMRS